MKNLFPIISNLSFIGLMLWLGILLFTQFGLPKNHAQLNDKNISLGTENSVKLSPIVRKGKLLFKSNCASCHATNMRTKLTGPALRNVRSKWKDYPEEDLYAWIRNSSLLIEKEHPRAVAIYLEYNKTPMTSFPNLTEEEITSILAYTEFPPK